MVKENSGIPHLRKQDIEIFEKVSIYKKVLSPNELHCLTQSGTYKFIRNLHH